MSTGAHLQKPEVKAKAVRSRVANLLEGLSPEDAAAFKEVLAQDLGLAPADMETDVAEEFGEATEVLTRDRDATPDYTKLLAALDRQYEKTEELMAEAMDDSTRDARMRRLSSLAQLRRITEAATKITAEPHTFGCRNFPRIKVSGRNSGFPDIQFKYHVYHTSDPLEIARLLDYMENPLPGDPPIRLLRSGTVALVDTDTGEFRRWVDGFEAEEAIAESGGAFRRPIK